MSQETLSTTDSYTSVETAPVVPGTTSESPRIDDFQFDTVIGMTAADALREGAKSLKQEFGGWGDGKETGCALTAMHHCVKDKGYI